VRNVIVARADEIAPGQRKIVEIGGRSIGVFNIGGHYYALRNRCPHQGGPLCTGIQFASLRSNRPGEYLRGGEGEVIRCPWHGWEFEIKTGRCWIDPERTRVRSYRAGLQPAASPDAERRHNQPADAERRPDQPPDAERRQDQPADAERYPTHLEGAYVVVELDR
jgi:nitrite reductase/ring-hydroxylating ferredoxin subunit